MDRELLDAIQYRFPAYLSPQSKEELFAGLSKFPGLDYFASAPGNFASVMQGDGWHGFVFSQEATIERKAGAGIVLSNTCDITDEREQEHARRIIYAPLIRLDRLERLYRDLGKTPQQIASFLTDVRAQRTTYTFYLPATAVTPEYLARLDMVESMQLSSFYAATRSRLFTLSNSGFYTFLIKLSLHFTRLMEGIDRAELG